MRTLRPLGCRAAPERQLATGAALSDWVGLDSGSGGNVYELRGRFPPGMTSLGVWVPEV